MVKHLFRNLTLSVLATLVLMFVQGWIGPHVDLPQGSFRIRATPPRAARALRVNPRVLVRTLISLPLPIFDMATQTIDLEVRELIQQARHYYKEALEQKDLRQMSEKAHLSATLASDALIIGFNMPKPQNLSERLGRLNSVSKKARLRYSAYMNDLHRNCFYDGLCIEEVVRDTIDDLSDYIETAERILRSKGLKI